MTLRWLQSVGEGGRCPSPKPTAGKKGFIEKTLGEIASFFRDGLFSEEYARKQGLLQRIDPRVKILTLAVFIVAVSFQKNFLPISAIYMGLLLLASLSGIPVRYFVTRVWLFIPLYAGIVVLPALLNVVVPGDPLLVLARFDSPRSIGPIRIPQVLAVTRQGVNVAGVFVMRVATSVSMVVLLLLTTRWSHLLKALKVLCIPQMFTFIIGMTYRYIHLLLRIMQDVHLAKKSRVIRKTRVGEGQRWVALQMGNVLTKSLLISEEVHLAMVSRGYAKEVKVIDAFGLKRADYLVMGVSVLAVVFLLWLNRSGG